LPRWTSRVRISSPAPTPARKGRRCCLWRWGCATFSPSRVRADAALRSRGVAPGFSMLRAAAGLLGRTARISSPQRKRWGSLGRSGAFRRRECAFAGGERGLTFPRGRAGSLVVGLPRASLGGRLESLLPLPRSDSVAYAGCDPSDRGFEPEEGSNLVAAPATVETLWIADGTTPDKRRPRPRSSAFQSLRLTRANGGVSAGVVAAACARARLEAAWGARSVSQVLCVILALCLCDSPIAKVCAQRKRLIARADRVPDHVQCYR
jgi:hypothetical protein